MQRQLLNVTGLASISAVTAAGVAAVNRTPAGAKGLYLVLDVTALAGVGASLQLIAEMHDEISGKYIALGTFTAVTATGTFCYAIGLGVGAASDGITATKSFPVPDEYRARVVGGGTSITNAAFTLSEQLA